MSTPERKKPPVSSKRSRHVREQSSSDFSIEELSPDDMGYDADIEVIRPNTYEEVESESDDATSPDRKWHSIDEELAARMGRLGQEQLPPLRSRSGRGRKRRSVEMDDDDSLLRVPPSPDLEVQEVIEHKSLPSPAKRRKKKSNGPNVALHLLRGHNEAWTDSSERTDGNGKALHDTSTSPTASERADLRRDKDDEMMDVT